MTPKVDLSVSIGDVKFRNPVVLTAGPMSRDGASIKKAAFAGAGAIEIKTIRMKAAKVPRPCIARVQGGLLNAELWSDLDYQTWIGRELKIAKSGKVPLIGSIGADNPDELKRIATGVTEAGVDIIGLSYQGAKETPALIRAVKKATDAPLILKFAPVAHESPDKPIVFFDPIEFGKIASENDVDAIEVMDTLGPCMKIDIETARPILGSTYGTGGMSGPALKPYSLALVCRLAQNFEVPILGIGGIATGEDAIEYIMAGATGVGVCTAAIMNGPEVIGRIVNQMNFLLEKKSITDIHDITGLTAKYIAARTRRKSLLTEWLPPTVDPILCTACGCCEASCPYDAISVGKKATVNTRLCYGCGLCSTVCPAKAIRL